MNDFRVNSPQLTKRIENVPCAQALLAVAVWYLRVG